MGGLGVPRVKSPHSLAAAIIHRVVGDSDLVL